MNEKKLKLEVIRIAKEMLNDNLNLILGCRYISGLRLDTDNSNDDIYLVFRAVSSETDHFIFGNVRELCSVDSLKRKDLEQENYLKLERDNIRNACINLIEKLTYQIDNMKIDINDDSFGLAIEKIYRECKFKLDPKDAEFIEKCIAYNEPAIAFETIVEKIQHNRIPISQRAYELIEQVGKAPNLAESYWTSLNCPVVK